MEIKCNRWYSNWCTTVPFPWDSEHCLGCHQVASWVVSTCYYQHDVTVTAFCRVLASAIALVAVLYKTHYNWKWNWKFLVVRLHITWTG